MGNGQKEWAKEGERRRVYLTFLFVDLSRIALCWCSLKNMNADLNRFGAPGARLNLIFWFFFMVNKGLVMGDNEAERAIEGQDAKQLVLLNDDESVLWVSLVRALG